MTIPGWGKDPLGGPKTNENIRAFGFALVALEDPNDGCHVDLLRRACFSCQSFGECLSPALAMAAEDEDATEVIVAALASSASRTIGELWMKLKILRQEMTGDSGPLDDLLSRVVEDALELAVATDSATCPR